MSRVESWTVKFSRNSEFLLHNHPGSFSRDYLFINSPTSYTTTISILGPLISC